MGRLNRFIVASICLLFVTTEASGECVQDEDSNVEGGDASGDDCEDSSEYELEENSDLSPGPRDDKMKGYGQLSAGLVFPVLGDVKATAKYYNYPGGEVEDGATLSATVLPSLNFAAFFVPHDIIHIGLYFQLTKGTASLDPELPEGDTWIRPQDQSEMTILGFGIATKTGFRPSERIYLGIEVDAGLHYLKFEAWEDEMVNGVRAFLGLALSPALVFDVLLLETEYAKITMPIRLGVEFVPISKGHNHRYRTDSPHFMDLEYNGVTDTYAMENLDYDLKLISLFASVGLTFGT